MLQQRQTWGWGGICCHRGFFTIPLYKVWSLDQPQHPQELVTKIGPQPHPDLPILSLLYLKCEDATPCDLSLWLSSIALWQII